MKHVILVAALTLGFAVRAYPCVVERILTVPEATRSAEAIFVGRVAAMTDQLEGSPDPNSYARRVVLDVRDVWKGPQRPQLVVWTLPGTGICGTPFVNGELFIVFAGRADHNTLVTDIIWPSARLTAEHPIPPSLGRPTWHNGHWRDSPASVGRVSHAPSRFAWLDRAVVRPRLPWRGACGVPL